MAASPTTPLFSSSNSSPRPHPQGTRCQELHAEPPRLSPESSTRWWWMINRRRRRRHHSWGSNQELGWVRVPTGSWLFGVLVRKQQLDLEVNASKTDEGDGRRFPEGKITWRPAADQWLADRYRRQLRVTFWVEWSLLGWTGRRTPTLRWKVRRECTFSGSWRSLAYRVRVIQFYTAAIENVLYVLHASSLAWQHHPGPEETSEPCHQEHAGRIVGRQLPSLEEIIIH